MKLPLGWLREFVAVDADVDEICRRLTLAGIEVENAERARPAFSDVVIAQVTAVERHPNADRLSLCQVDAGPVGQFSVVCGAPNVRAGMIAAYARVGARLMAGVHGQGDAASIELAPPLTAAVIRGIKSDGMLCSERELGLSDEHKGILDLDSGTLGADFAASLGLDDVVLDIAITPNRGDCLSVLGLAREIAALFEIPLIEPRIAPIRPRVASSMLVEIAIDAADLCPRYAALVMADVKIGPSPIKLRRRLELAGMRPISNVVDATNYVMLELGQPLHAFDYERIGGKRIIVRRAGSDRTMVTLDGATRDLVPDDLVIADANGPVALAGVMGGHNSEVSEATRSILLESAYFEPPTVARTARRLGLRSEAGYRFERGIDRAGQVRALNRIAKIVAEFAGGRVAGPVVDIEARPPQPRIITLELDSMKALLGVEMAPAEVRRRLRALGAEVASGGRGRMIITAPHFRPDLNEPADLAEEVVRLKGLSEVPAQLPLRPAAGPLMPDPSRQFAKASREVMLGSGLTEIKTLAFIAPAENERFIGIASGDPVRVSNPLSAELSEMRRSLVPGLLGALRFNLNRQASAFHAFEIGRTYVLREGIVAEGERIAAVSYGDYVLGGVGQPSIAADFATAKGIIENYLESIGGRLVAHYEPLGPSAAPYLHPSRSARIVIDDQTAGYVGELHPREGARLGLDRACNFFELDLTMLLAYGPTLPGPIELPPRFPAVRRDVALVVDSALPAAVLVGTIRECAPLLLEGVKVFDVYEGESLPEGKKSVALACLYRAAERTLTDDEVNRVHAELVGKVRARLGVDLRK